MFPEDGESGDEYDGNVLEERGYPFEDEEGEAVSEGEWTGEQYLALDEIFGAGEDQSCMTFDHLVLYLPVPFLHCSADLACLLSRHFRSTCLRRPSSSPSHPPTRRAICLPPWASSSSRRKPSLSAAGAVLPWRSTGAARPKFLPRRCSAMSESIGASGAYCA